MQTATLPDILVALQAAIDKTVETLVTSAHPDTRRALAVDLVALAMSLAHTRTLVEINTRIAAHG